MPIFAKWSTGVHHELELVAELFNGALASGATEPVVAFKDSLAVPEARGGARLLAAVAQLAHDLVGPGAAAAKMTAAGFVPDAIDRDWFSPDQSQWRFDSELSPEQMHEIMRQAGVAIADLCLDGKRVEMLTQCNHNRMHVDIYQPGPDDQEPARIWIFVPSNSGWLPTQVLDRDTIVNELRVIAAGNPPGAGYGPGTELRRRLLIDIDSVVSQAGNSYLPYRESTVLFQWGGGYESAAPDGAMHVGYEPERVEPGKDQTPDDSINRPNGNRKGATVISWVGHPVAGRRPAAPVVHGPELANPAFWQFPIRWFPDSGIGPDLEAELGRLQANILRPHGREVARYLMLQVTEQPDRARQWLSELTVTSALDELRTRVDNDRNGGPVVTCGLSHTGFARLEVPHPAGTVDPEFSRGFWAGRDFADRPRPDETDILVVVAGTIDQVEAEVARLTGNLAGSGLRLLAHCTGQMLPRSPLVHGGDPAQRPRPVDTVEPFGHVDGISNPRFFTFDIDEMSPLPAATMWPTGRSPLVAVVPERVGEGFGSYFVFQKLKQDRWEFELRSRDRARHAPAVLGKPMGHESALVGRRPDGSVPWDPPGQPATVQANDFTWDTARGELAADGGWMPHIRAVNDRRPDGPVIVRRSIPYQEDDEVGLLFGAYMASIADQFALIERHALYHQDPFIPAAGNTMVTLRDGGYFYAPSPAFLSSLGAA